MNQRLCAVRFPGTSRARFVDAGSIQCEPGDWVVFTTEDGDEAALVVIAPDQWTEPASMPDAPLISRLLDDREREQLAQQIKQSRDLISPAADLFRSEAPDCALTGLRVTLDGQRAVVTFRGSLPDAEYVSSKLRNVLELAVRLEQESVAGVEHSLLGGATGDPDHSTPESLQELLEARMDVFRDPSIAAPQGIPRLNNRVQTPRGVGRLIAVDIRHWNATVALDDGDEATLSVDELSMT